MQNPLFIVISAPSGAGKTTLCDLLLQSYPEICYSVSCTTREPRLEEEDGIDYHFMDPATFQRHVEAGSFLEHATVHGHGYGTLKGPIYDALNAGQGVLLDIDVAGAAQIRGLVARLPPHDPLRRGYLDIFIHPPSLEELANRLKRRNADPDAVIETRLRNAHDEIAQAGQYMYQVVNDDLEIAYRKLCDIISARAGLI